uniref:Reverse transcriptase domain-containing protein n=1 Tax=Trichobilharzia regenti TaxID=157069 RepID=A0AA85K0D8_TRIRE|nr:unnamed protein product [Trichobilharzia regenti]
MVPFYSAKTVVLALFKVIIFLDLKAAFDSVDREVLWRCLAVKGIPRKYIELIKALYSYSYSQVRAYGELSSELVTTSGVRQRCPLSPFLFNFIIDVLMDLTLSDFSDSRIDLLPGNNLVGLEYADDIVLLGEDADEMQSSKHLEPQSTNVWHAIRSRQMQDDVTVLDYIDA